MEIVKLSQNIKEGDNQMIGVIDRDIKSLRYDINQLTKNNKSIELMLKKANAKETMQTHDKKTVLKLLRLRKINPHPMPRS